MAPSLLPPLLAWAIALLGLLLLAAVNGFDPFQGETWAHGDSGHYLSVATQGYELHRCPPGYFGGPENWCGNAGWFPAYPTAVGALDRLGLPLRASAIALSWSLALATLVVLWRTFLRNAPPLQALAALAFAAFAPGQVFHYAVFPMSLLGLTTVLSLWWLSRGRWLAAGVAGAVAAASYPLGAVLIPVTAWWIVATGRTVKPLELLRRIALTSGLAGAGFFAVALLMRLETGYWDAFFKIQEKYSGASHNPGVELPSGHRGVALPEPLGTLVNRVEPVFQGGFDAGRDAVELQTLLVAVVVLVVTVHTVVRWRRASATDWLLLLATLAIWTVSLTQGRSLYRSEAALLPVAGLIRCLPAPLGFALAVAALGVSIPFVGLYFDSVLP